MFSWCDLQPWYQETLDASNKKSSHPIPVLVLYRNRSIINKRKQHEIVKETHELVYFDPPVLATEPLVRAAWVGISAGWRRTFFACHHVMSHWHGKSGRPDSVRCPFIIHHLSSIIHHPSSIIHHWPLIKLGLVQVLLPYNGGSANSKVGDASVSLGKYRRLYYLLEWRYYLWICVWWFL